MPLVSMSDYNRGARIYWWTTVAIGSLALCSAILAALQFSRESLIELVLLMAAAGFAGLYPIRIPGTQNSITAGDTFIFLAALSLGVPGATLVAVADVLAASCRMSQRWTSRIGGPAITAIAIFVSASSFGLTLKQLGDSSLLNTVTLLLALLLFGLLHFALNTMLLAANQALKLRQSLFKIWWSSYSWIGLTHAGSAAAAGLVFLAIGRHGITAVLAAGPLVGVIFATCQFYFKQAEERARASERISRLHFATVEALATAINAKDQITSDHVYRVQVYACGLARHFNLTHLEIEALKAGAVLHDVGKIAVPDYILNKPGKLTAAEFDKMKLHTVIGARILERVNFPYPVVPIVRHHHERWDGRGYPDGLKRDGIPMTARILSVVDCFDAVSEDRQYRKGLSRKEACQLLRNGAGKQFDPMVVEAFLENLSTYEQEIVAHKAAGLPFMSPTAQSGLSDSARLATPAAGLASEVPDYVKQINAAHAEVATLYEMAQTLTANLDPRDIAALTVNHLKRAVPFTTCVVYLRRNDGSVVAEHVFGENAESIRGKSLETGCGIAGWVTVNRREMTNTDPILDLGYFAATGWSGYRTAAVFPLAGDGEVIGALALYSAEVDAYTTEQLHLLESMTRITSCALQRSLIYEQGKKASGQTDALTGLPNSRALYAHLGHELDDASQHGLVLTVLSFNLFGMRAVNESHGYQAGDQLLVEVAELLRGAMAGRGFLSRIAGKEFVCILKGRSRNEASILGASLAAAVERFGIESKEDCYLQIGLSFGLAEFPADGKSVNGLLKAATGQAYRHAALARAEPVARKPSAAISTRSPRLRSAS